jgi:hypothetical protein
MATLDSVLQQLRSEHKQAQAAVGKLEQAISAIEGLNGNHAETTLSGTRPKKTMSAAARRRIAQAQRARWAKVRKQSSPHASGKPSNSGKPRISAEGRKRIAAAARARWARVRAQQRKKAA